MKKPVLNITTALKAKLIFSSKDEKYNGFKFLSNFAKDMSKAANYCSIELYKHYLDREFVSFKSLSKDEQKEIRKKMNQKLADHKKQVYKKLTDKFPNINTANISQLMQEVSGNFNGKNFTKIMNCEKQVPSYNATSFGIYYKNYKLYKIEDKYFINVTFNSSKVNAENRNMTFQFVTGASQKAILDKIFLAYDMKGDLKTADWEQVIKSNNLYKPGGLKIKWSEKNRTWNIFLTCKYYKDIDKTIKKAVTYRIGITKMLQGCFSDAKHYTSETQQDTNNKLAIEGNDVLATWKQFDRRRRSYQYDSKHSARKSTGRRNILKPTEKLREKYDNYRNTKNFNIAKWIATNAKNNNAVVGILDWKDIKSDIAFIPQWNWLDLNDKIRNACKKHGVPIVEVPSKNIAKTCSKCNHQFDERPKTNIYKCPECGYYADLPYNEAKITSLLAWKQYCDENGIEKDSQYKKAEELLKVL